MAKKIFVVYVMDAYSCEQKAESFHETFELAQEQAAWLLKREGEKPADTHDSFYIREKELICSSSDLSSHNNQHYLWDELPF